MVDVQTDTAIPKAVLLAWLKIDLKAYIVLFCEEVILNICGVEAKTCKTIVIVSFKMIPLVTHNLLQL